MSIKKRNGIYHYDFTCNGKRYRGSTGQTIEKEARKFEREKIAGLKGQQSIEALSIKIKNDLGVKMPIHQVFDNFLKVPRRRTPNEKQIQGYKRQWSDFVRFININHPVLKYISEITPQIAKEYIQHIRTQGRFSQDIKYKRKNKTIIDKKRENKALSPTTQNRYLETCKMIFNTIFADHPHIDNPFANIEKVENRRAAREAFTPDELKLIGEKGENKYFYPVFIVGISTGLRLGDICNMKWSVVDLERGWIDKLVMRKTGNEVSLPMLPGLYKYISELNQDSDYVFPVLQKKYETDSSAISRDIRKFLESIDIKSNRLFKGRQQKVSVKGAHSLRHTFAYLAGVHGIPLPIVQSILGHMSPEMTKMYSDHATNEAKQLHLAKLPDYLTENTDKEYRHGLTRTGTDGNIEYIVERLKKEPRLIARVMEVLSNQ